ncbi:MAG: NlpC/P60 family protein, partial [Actinomycetia bacterium]|nr:NlpC/P60 family protein [Actinomycetes bacterium]
ERGPSLVRTGQHKFNRGRAAVVVCAALVAGLTTTGAPSSVASPDDPSLAEVQDRVGSLNHQAEQANERYLQLIDQVSETRKDLKATRKDVREQRAKFKKIKRRVTQSLVADATDSPLGTAGQLLSSEDPEQFINGLTAIQAYNSTQTDMLAEYTSMSDELETRQGQLEDQLSSIEDAKDKMSKEKAEVQEKADQAEALLADLEADQRQEVLENAGHDEPSRDDDRDEVDGGSDGGDTGTDPGPTNASGAAAAAIAFAKDQLGEPYVYGAAGPDSWDCSGLTSGAYAAAGIALPRSSGSQAGVGTPVSTSSMSPGDLVFYYSPISHVGIYLGNGQLIHAPNSGSVVQIVDVNLMPITAVRRVA